MREADSVKKFESTRLALMVLVFCAAVVITSSAQNLTTLINFDGSDGFDTELMSLVQGTDGNFYGTTSYGGTNNLGTVFKITPEGRLTTLHSFDMTDGATPYAGLVQAHNGNFYGTTAYGGSNNDGVVFKITAEGTLTTLYSFCSIPNCNDGARPQGTLVEATNGDFYGTTASSGGNQRGTIYKITQAGKFTTVYNFCSLPNCADGGFPAGGLVQATDGDFYGTTGNGGSSDAGTVFRMTPGGRLTTLHNFDGTHGSEPYSTLVQATDGNFYGTTLTGGGINYGTAFKITPGGNFTMLHSFCFRLGCPDGYFPFAGLVQANDGNFYGTTYGGGRSTTCSECGTLFKITPEGKLTTVHSFDQTDGVHPSGGLLQATDGILYGTTPFGGDLTCNPGTGCGTVFGLFIGLGPVEKAIPPPSR
jgi:uncharacterized repeat protein (TIGR03803 family)